MSISDKELFNYIFYPDKLSEEQKSFIKNNLNEFKGEINLLELTKSAMDENISEEILNRIHKKIKNFENTSLVILEKINKKADLDKDLLILAADSPEEEETNKIETYADKNSKYLVKVISNSSENKLHIFNKDNEEIKDFQITVLPSGEIFNIESSNFPLVIKPSQEITSLSFNF